MVDYRKCRLEDILEDAKDSQKKTKALKEFALSGDKPSFLTIKRFYYSQFYEDLLPKKAEQKPTMWELIAEL